MAVYTYKILAGPPGSEATYDLSRQSLTKLLCVALKLRRTTVAAIVCPLRR